MDVSVIVVTYNQERTIGRTLDSVLGQKFDGDFEIVIGDDCSEDDTRRVCEEYSRRYPNRVRYLRWKKNMGVVANYFACIRRADGRYLADCAGDDRWSDPHKLAREYEFLEKHPDVTAVYTDWLCCNPDGTGLRRHELRPEVTGIEVYDRGALVLPVLTNSVMLHLCTALYRKNVILRYIDKYMWKFTSETYVAEDPQIMMALSDAGRVAVLPGVTLHYSVGGDSISRRRDCARRLRHYVGETRQQLALAELFGVGRDEIEGYLRKKMDYMWSLAWRARNGSQVRLLGRLYGLRTGWKSKVYRVMLRLAGSPA